MSANDWKPWYERVADFDTAKEREEFLKGVSPVKFASSKSVATHLLLAGVIAGYVGNRIAKSGRDKRK
jgi:hypothetical protein